MSLSVKLYIVGMLQTGIIPLPLQYSHVDRKIVYDKNISYWEIPQPFDMLMKNIPYWEIPQLLDTYADEEHSLLRDTTTPLYVDEKHSLLGDTTSFCI